MNLRFVLNTAVLLVGHIFQLAQAALPEAVLDRLQQAQIPPEAISVYVASADAQPMQMQMPALLAWNAQRQMNPASVMKLVTTYAALDQLGAAYVWRTPFYLDGVQRGNIFDGSVYIQGVGDPSLVSERLWLLMGRLRGLGVQEINGDIILDRSAFELEPHDPSAFDGEPFRPYNVGADALLINYNSQVLGFVPDRAAGIARIHYELPMAGIKQPQSVPLAPPSTQCQQVVRAHLQLGWKAQGNGTLEMQLSGQYPPSCGVRNWPMALPQPELFAQRSVQGMWEALGGSLRGRVRQAAIPSNLQPAWDSVSPALAEVVRNINKHSNNVMTQQLLLTIGKESGMGASFAGGRRAIDTWWRSRWPQNEAPVIENGAGLSRDARISAAALGQMLQSAWRSSVMPEFIASLPIAGMDGTMRRSKTQASAHLKTGSLRGVNTIAGYVDSYDGQQRYVLVALVNHENAAAARPALDALIDWTAAQQNQSLR